MASVLKNFEHHLLRELRNHGVGKSLLLVAVSGGVDSMALLAAIRTLQPLLDCELAAAHIHHGWRQGDLGVFRDRAWVLVRNYCQLESIPFYSNLLELKPHHVFHTEPAVPLLSEEDLRDFRYNYLRDIQSQLTEQKGLKTLILTAHNANDQLETQLMRLIRGTGEQGLAGMRPVAGDIHRPLLSFDRQQILEYVESRQIPYINDPSNSSVDPFRNWLRNNWLPLLENKRPGALQSLARSLTNLVEEKNSETNDLDQLIDDGINLSLFLELSPSGKRRVLARYMRQLGIKNYGLSHILEIMKRLDTNQKSYSFSLLKHSWTVNAERIKARPI